MVKFRSVSLTTYNSLATKDANTLYIVTDATNGNNKICLGDSVKAERCNVSFANQKLVVNGIEVDLSVFATAEEVSSAITTALADYYTSTQVDNKIATAISNVYKIKGTKTVAQINALDPSPQEGTPTVVVGDVYNVSDSGNINVVPGSSATTIAVSAGDNVVYTADGWDKLAATVNLDWSAIQNKPTTISGYGITDAKIENGTVVPATGTTVKKITLGSENVEVVAAEAGKGLSTNDFNNTYKGILDNLSTTYATKAELENVEFTVSTALNQLNSRVSTIENALDLTGE